MATLQSSRKNEKRPYLEKKGKEAEKSSGVDKPCKPWSWDRVHDGKVCPGRGGNWGKFLLKN